MEKEGKHEGKVISHTPYTLLRRVGGYSNRDPDLQDFEDIQDLVDLTDLDDLQDLEDVQDL